MSNGFYESEGPQKDLHMRIIENGEENSSAAYLDCANSSSYCITIHILSDRSPTDFFT